LTIALAVYARQSIRSQDHKGIGSDMSETARFTFGEPEAAGTIVIDQPETFLHAARRERGILIRDSSGKVVGTVFIRPTDDLVEMPELTDEDREDIRNARIAMKEEGPSIPWETLEAELGL
jgi:hypothetical protein